MILYLCIQSLKVLCLFSFTAAFLQKKSRIDIIMTKMYNCLNHSDFISAKSLQAQLSPVTESKCSIVLTTHAKTTTSILLFLDAPVEVDLAQALPSVAACSQLCSSARTVSRKRFFHSKLCVLSHMTHWNAGVSDSLILISVLSHIHTNGDLVVLMVDAFIIRFDRLFISSCLVVHL